MANHGQVTLTEETWDHFGLELGVPAEIKIVFVEDKEAPKDGIAAVGIGEPVPWEAYPFPKPPERLEVLERQGYYGDRQSLLAADGAHSTVIQRGVRYEVRAISQTPGMLHIHVDGVLVDTLTWWDYRAVDKIWTTDWNKFGPSIEGRTTGTLTVIPEHMSGDWLMVVLPRS